jgi:metal-responsive CopG/Arc/MetJ family transcriptional regulator
VYALTGSGCTLAQLAAEADTVRSRILPDARRARRSRSAVFSAALREYVARHAPDEVTDAMDRVCAAVNDERDGFVTAAARLALERTEW